MLCSFCQILNVILVIAYLNSKKLYSFIIVNSYFYPHVHGLGLTKPKRNIYSKI